VVVGFFVVGPAVRTQRAVARRPASMNTVQPRPMVLE
jgi:hypothetical protein